MQRRSIDSTIQLLVPLPVNPTITIWLKQEEEEGIMTDDEILQSLSRLIYLMFHHPTPNRC